MIYEFLVRGEYLAAINTEKIATIQVYEAYNHDDVDSAETGLIVNGDKLIWQKYYHYERNANKIDDSMVSDLNILEDIYKEIIAKLKK